MAQIAYHWDNLVINYFFYAPNTHLLHAYVRRIKEVLLIGFYMCILFIAVNQHPDYPLIIAANRDEFHARLTQASHFWDEYPGMLAGKDCQAGGTW